MEIIDRQELSKGKVTLVAAFHGRTEEDAMAQANAHKEQLDIEWRSQNKENYGLHTLYARQLVFLRKFGVKIAQGETAEVDLKKESPAGHLHFGILVSIEWTYEDAE